MGGRVQLAGRRGGQLYLVPIRMYTYVPRGGSWTDGVCNCTGSRGRRAAASRTARHGVRILQQGGATSVPAEFTTQPHTTSSSRTYSLTATRQRRQRATGRMQSGNLKIQIGVAPGGGRGAGHSRVTVHRERPSPPSVGRHRRVCRVMCAARRPSCGARNYPRFYI